MDALERRILRRPARGVAQGAEIARFETPRAELDAANHARVSDVGEPHVLLHVRAMSGEQRTYTREEMDAILKRALERQQAQAEGIAHDDLVAAAAEVGIAREDIEAAARDLAAEKGAPRPNTPAVTAARITERVPGRELERDESGADDARRRRRELLRSAATWAIFSALFYGIGVFTGTNWWIWPVMGWGLAVALQAVRVAFPREHAPGASRKTRRELRHERRQRKREARLREFEARVSIGADALVRVIDQVRRAKDEASKNEEVAAVRARVAEPGAEESHRVPVRVSSREPGEPDPHIAAAVDEAEELEADSVRLDARGARSKAR